MCYCNFDTSILARHCGFGRVVAQVARPQVPGRGSLLSLDAQTKARTPHDSVPRAFGRRPVIAIEHCAIPCLAASLQARRLWSHFYPVLGELFFFLGLAQADDVNAATHMQLPFLVWEFFNKDQACAIMMCTLHENSAP